MSEVEAGAAGEAPTGGRDKRAWAEEVLGDILRLMGARARVEVREVPAPAGGGPSLSAAIFPDEEFAGLQPGRRSPLVDSMQFLANKIVNRGPDKRWIALGVGGHPEPRPPPPKPARAPQPSPPPPPAPAAQAPRPPRPERPERAPRPPPAEPDESSAPAATDPQLEAAARRLAERAAARGRVYAVTGMTPEHRALVARVAREVAGVQVRVEGEGRHRRVSLLPLQPRPMPKKSAMPDYDVEDDAEE